MLKLMLTDKCNLRCRYCYEGDKKSFAMNYETGRLAIEMYFDRLLGSFENLGFIPITYHGGEPLLEFDLMKKLTECANDLLEIKKGSKNMRCTYSFTTNGVLLDETMFGFFRDNNFDISVSIDGNKEIHNLNRVDYKNNGSFDEVIYNLQKLHEALGDKVTARMTVTPETIYHMYESVCWLYENDFHTIGLCLDYFSDWSGKEGVLDEQFSLIKKMYINLKKENKDIYIDIIDGKINIYINKLPTLFCNAGFGSYTVDADGQIYPCVYAINKGIVIGDVENGVKDELEIRDIYRKNVEKAQQKCFRCDISYFCHARKCGFLNLATTNYLTVSNPSVCIQEKILYYHIKDIVNEMHLK